MPDLWGGPSFLFVHPQLWSHQSPATSGTFCASYSSSLPGSDFQSLSFYTQPLHILVNICLKLERAEWRHWPSMQVSLHSSCCTLVAMFFSEVPKFSVCPGWFPTCQGISQHSGVFPLSQFPPRGTGPIRIPFLLFFFCPTWLHGNCLALSEVWGLLSAFSSYSVRAVSHVDIFLMYWWEEVSSCPTILPSWLFPHSVSNTKILSGAVQAFQWYGCWVWAEII